ncbi:MAG: RNA polymerase sigma factor [Caldilineaceae bacterium]|nr:RNA polymerase sigma factor [Caldilineaceae bacterium]
MTLDDLYDTYESSLQRYANSLVHDYDRADDLVQETFIRSLGHLPLLATLRPAQCRAWLKRTLKNLFIDEERKRQRQQRLLQELAVEEVISESETFAGVLTPNPLANVPEDVRELFEMRYTLGMNSTEIGESLGIPAATVRSRLNYNLQKLRQYRGNWE